MFGKLLVANRGEIACRVMRTAHRLGIRTVAVYSDADRDAPHVAMAGEAWRLGPAPASRSYLDIERVLAAAAASGADAVHPGYGFLSENPAFVDACAAAGIAFVGPPAAAVRAMGLKDAAKRVMEDAGVPVVPGYHGEDQEDTVLLDHARRIGFPVLVKAVAGGGGKGMRRADDAAGFKPALEAARREARSSFGDDRVLVERCIERPRHVEVQVFADAHGNAVHLFERDCSLQRRHQKVVEETPAPGMTPQMRAAMGAAALTAARAIDYRNAGTVEFIADASEGLRQDRFWFMEMNTRLQVEHPVTEMVTGTDLVEWQLRVAAGETLPLAQAELSMAGHAVEARVYAEDPGRGFLPSTGVLAHLDTPPESAGVRIDLGVREGDTVTPHYDPMIAKVIAHGEDRAAALARLAGALRGFEVAGVATNVAFLARLLADPEFRAGDADTGLIDRRLDALLAREPVPDAVLAIAAMHAAGALAADTGRIASRGAGAAPGTAPSMPHRVAAGRDAWTNPGTASSIPHRVAADRDAWTEPGTAPSMPHGVAAGRDAWTNPGTASSIPRRVAAGRDAWTDPWAALTGWRAWSREARIVHFSIDGEDVEAPVMFLEGGGCRIGDGSATTVARLMRREGTRIVLDLTDRVVSARIVAAGDGLHVLHDGRTWTVSLPNRAVEDGDAGDAVAHVTAPLPGKVAKVAVRSGDTVERGATLAVLEAMKMELSVEAPREGVIDEVLVAEGDQVIEGAVLVTFAPATERESRMQ